MVKPALKGEGYTSWSTHNIASYYCTQRGDIGLNDTPLLRGILDLPLAGIKIKSKSATPEEGATTYQFTKFCRKLHKNERLWTERRRVPGAHLDLPLVCNDNLTK